MSVDKDAMLAEMQRIGGKFVVGVETLDYEVPIQ